jgi:hypothetical protein
MSTEDMERSSGFQLNTRDLINLAKNAALVGGAAALTVVAENVKLIDFGVYSPLVTTVLAMGLDTILKWAKNNNKK